MCSSVAHCQLSWGCQTSTVSKPASTALCTNASNRSSNVSIGRYQLLAAVSPWFQPSVMFQSSCWATRFAPMKDRLKFIGVVFRSLCSGAGVLLAGGAGVREEVDLAAGAGILDVHGVGDVLERQRVRDQRVDAVSRLPNGLPHLRCHREVIPVPDAVDGESQRHEVRQL